MAQPVVVDSHLEEVQEAEGVVCPNFDSLPLTFPINSSHQKASSYQKKKRVKPSGKTPVRKRAEFKEYTEGLAITSGAETDAAGRIHAEDFVWVRLPRRSVLPGLPSGAVLRWSG
jgi:hypothetical protein